MPLFEASDIALAHRGNPDVRAKIGYLAQFIAGRASRNRKLRGLQQCKAMCNHGFARQLNALRQLVFIA